jgi:hypothetical protein
MRTILVLVLTTAVAGCSGKAANAPIELDKLPPNLLKISQEKLPEVKFEHAVRKPNGIYEISGRDKKGKVRDVELTESGEVTEIE